MCEFAEFCATSSPLTANETEQFNKRKRNRPA
jgi:hypothetical protein